MDTRRMGGRIPAGDISDSLSTRCKQGSHSLEGLWKESRRTLSEAGAVEEKHNNSLVLR